MLIGLSAPAKSGKDQVGSILAGRGFVRKSFAAQVKAIAKKLFSLDDEQLHTYEGKETIDPRWQTTPRAILQQIGGLMRGIHPKVWTRFVFSEFSPGSNVVITDVRYPSELAEIREHGGYVVRINRPGAGSRTGAADDSETALNAFDGWDYVINNDGTLDDLEDKVLGMLHYLRAKAGQ